jgi:hypothetical protein
MATVDYGGKNPGWKRLSRHGRKQGVNLSSGLFKPVFSLSRPEVRNVVFF